MSLLLMEGREVGSLSSPTNLAKLRHPPVPLKRSLPRGNLRRRLMLISKRVEAKTWRRYDLYG